MQQNKNDNSKLYCMYICTLIYLYVCIEKYSVRSTILPVGVVIPENISDTDRTFVRNFTIQVYTYIIVASSKFVTRT